MTSLPVTMMEEYLSLVAVLPTNEMMVVGGRIKGWQNTDNYKVEVASFNLS